MGRTVYSRQQKAQGSVPRFARPALSTRVGTSRRIDDLDFVWWFQETGFLDDPVSALPSPEARLYGNVQATGHGGGHDLHYRTLQAMGVTLLGRLVGVEGRKARFAPDLAASVAWGDERYSELADRIRKHVAERGLPAFDMREPEPFDAAAPEELDLSGFRGRRERGRSRPLLRGRPLAPQAQVVRADRCRRGRRDRGRADRRLVREDARRRVAVVEDQGVPVRIREVGLVADGAVHRLALERDAA